MAVDDRWYLAKRGPNGERLPSRKHGQGKRWRVRYVDAAGTHREKHYERKVDADAFDLHARSGLAVETRTDQAEKHTTFRDYAERWRSSREIGQALDYRRHTESRLRHHRYPYLGHRRNA